MQMSLNITIHATNSSLLASFDLHGSVQVSTFCMYKLCYTPPPYPRYLDAIERAVANGDCLLLENIGESVDPVLDPLLGRLTIKKGKYIKIGDKEVEYSPRFRFILQVSITEPHA